MRMALVKLALATGVGLVTLAACGSENDGYDPTVPTTVEYVSGRAQTNDAGNQLPDLLTVRTTNFVGDPVSGVTVEWFVLSGGGSVTPGSTVTDVNGLAQVSWELGPIVGAQTVQAVADLAGSPVTFGATALQPDDGGGGGGVVRIR